MYVFGGNRCLFSCDGCLFQNEDPTSIDTIEPVVIDPTESKSMFTFALPMYSVGIVLFFIYTCCKVRLVSPRPIASIETIEHVFSIFPDEIDKR